MSIQRLVSPIRHGSVLIVMMGISLIIIGLILTLSVKTKKSISDSSIIAKHAQAHLMLQGALMYLSSQYPAVAAPPWNRNCWDISNKAPESPPGSNRLPGIGITGGVCTELAKSFNIPSSTPYLPVQNAGWFYITWDAAAGGYFIVAAGGGSQGRTIASKKPYDVCYYFFYNPASRTLSPATWPNKIAVVGPPAIPAWPTADPKLWP